MKSIKWNELHPNSVAKKLRFEKVKSYDDFKGSQDEIYDYQMIFAQWKEWKLNGQNTYIIADELKELFIKTDVGDVRYDMFKLPFKSFYVKLQTDFLGFDGFYANDDNIEGDHISSGLVYSFYFTKSTSLIQYSNTGIWFGDKQEPQQGLKTIDANIHTISEAVNIRNKRIEHAIEDQLKGIPIEFNGDRFPGGFGDFTWDIEKRSKAVNFAVNCILYLISTKADIKQEYPSDVPTGFIDRLKKAKNKTQKEVARRTISNAGYSIINLVGSSFEKSKSTSDETHTVATHWRRGHWRNQPYLNGEKKLIWIMPVIVNAKNGEPAKGHIYKT